jgi:hypothetical protein
MEQNMFPRTVVRNELEKFVLVELYTDRETPEDQANRALEQKLVGTVAIPVYVIMSPDEKVLQVFQGSTRDEKEFLAFLSKGLGAQVASR